MDNILENAILLGKKFTCDGAVASYIPELSKADKDCVGLYLIDNNHNHFYAGDYQLKFTIQSLSKVPLLIKVLMDTNIEAILKRVTLSSTSKNFNSMSQLETDNNNKPFNPFINSGAIALIELLNGDTFEDKFNGYLDFLKKITSNNSLSVHNDTYTSESETGFKNIAIANFLKSVGIIEGTVSDTTDLYFKMCSIEVTAKDIAHIGHLLSCDNNIISKDIRRKVVSLMSSCGLYNGSSKFSAFVGMPSKSSVSGGILSVLPYKMSICSIGPSLDKKGNSISGTNMLEYLSKELNLNIFA